MAGRCSKHLHLELGCATCASAIRHALIRFNEMLASAEAVGVHTCEACGYEYYRVIGRCPACWMNRR
jgi:rubrerythrin